MSLYVTKEEAREALIHECARTREVYIKIKACEY